MKVLLDRLVDMVRIPREEAQTPCFVLFIIVIDEFVTQVGRQFNLILHKKVWILAFIPEIDFFFILGGIVKNSRGGRLADLVGCTFFFLHSSFLYLSSISATFRGGLTVLIHCLLLPFDQCQEPIVRR